MPKPIRIKNSAEFDSLMKGLARDIVDSALYFYLHQNLNNSIPNYITELNQIKAFWRLTISAQIDAALIRLCRAYDSHTASLSLPRLLLTVETNLEIFDTPNFKERLKDNPFVESLAEVSRVPDKTRLKSDIALVSESNTLVGRLLKWRNNFGAHRNPREMLAPNSIVVDPLTLEEIEILVERAVLILNRYSKLFSAHTYSTSMIGADDYKYVLDCI